MNNPAVKRLARELQEVRSDSQDILIEAEPLQDNWFEWHFTLPGPEDSVYQAGRYHGRIIFPSDYPFSPPNISFLTPNGRFETDKKICLSVTGFHPESWQPAWTIRTILLALRDHFVTEDKTAIGYLGYTAEARADLAKKSLHWRCSKCGYGRPPSASSSESSINKCASQEAFSQEPSTALPNSSAYVNFGSLLIFLLAVAIGYYCFLESNFMK